MGLECAHDALAHALRRQVEDTLLLVHWQRGVQRQHHPPATVSRATVSRATVSRAMVSRAMVSRAMVSRAMEDVACYIC